MDRRDFIALVGGTAASPMLWPLALAAQQPAMPVIGWLNPLAPATITQLIAAFHQGLEDTGYVEGRSLEIEYRWADGRYAQLPAMAADLAHRKVAAIYAVSPPAVLAAKAATTMIPIVFLSGLDPVKSGLTLALATLAGLLLTRKMMAPIQALHTGVARIGSGDLSQRISIKTGDELQALGDQFNSMAARLEESYSTLERRVEERTHQLELANLAKSRFLAAASHDLRQPLHALGLFIAELGAHVGSAEGRRVVERIDAAVAAMNELFNALLDTSKLDAGVLSPNLTEFPIEPLLRRIESTFAAAAQEKRLSLRIASSKAWVRSDVVLLERILLNLLSNAVRYTSRGGVVVGCRRRGEQLRIEVWDSGPGIPEDQQKNVFGEFYQLAGPDRERHAGLGLGLSIVDRLCGILEHRIELISTVGRGSRFTVVVPMAPIRLLSADVPSAPAAAMEVPTGELVVIVEDEPLGLEGMGGLLRSWGFCVVAARDESEALAGVGKHDRRPDLIISDYQLLGARRE